MIITKHKGFSFYILPLFFATICFLGCKAKSMQKPYRLVDAKSQKSIIISDVLKGKQTAFILVRHAEKELDQKNPGLTLVGQERARELDGILKDIDLDKIYSSDYNRTKLTAEPTKNSHGLETLIYNPKKLDDFVSNELNHLGEEKILIVGHSNSTPNLLNTITGTTDYHHMDESDYDNLFVVLRSKNTETEVLHFNFGVETSVVY